MGGKTLFRACNLACKYLLATTPCITGTMLIFKIVSNIRYTGTGAACPTSSYVKNGLIKAARTVVSKVNAIDSALSPFAR